MQIPLLSQNDDRWAWKKLGTSTESIGDYGCLLTCFTMMSSWQDVNAMNDYRVSKNGYYNGSWASTFDLLGATPHCKFVDVSERYQSTPMPEPEISKLLSHLDKGHPAILEVNWNVRFRKWLSWAKYDMHFVLINPNQKIYDPWPSVGDPGQVCDLVPSYGKTWSEALVRVVYYQALD